MRVSGHSQLPVAGLKARPGSQGIPFAVTREQTPGGPGEGELALQRVGVEAVD